MAFATSNVMAENSGSTTIVRGTWTAAVGDAAGTMTINGAALGAEFRSNLTTGAQQPHIHVSGLGSSTLTIYHQATVTDGRFWVKFK